VRDRGRESAPVHSDCGDGNKVLGGKKRESAVVLLAQTVEAAREIRSFQINMHILRGAVVTVEQGTFGKCSQESE
jgi:hypothetical protein